MVIHCASINAKYMAYPESTRLRRCLDNNHHWYAIIALPFQQAIGHGDHIMYDLSSL